MKRLTAKEAAAISCQGLCVTPEFTVTAEDPKSKQPSFSMLAYNGGKLGQWFGMVAVDLSDINIPAPTPILFSHNDCDPLGHGTVNNNGKQLRANGVIDFMETSENARKVVEGGKKNFPWQASIGANPGHIDKADDGEEFELNGQKLKGPCYIFRQTDLKEISIVVNGADSNTATKIQAKLSKENVMDPEEEEKKKAEAEEAEKKKAEAEEEERKKAEAEDDEKNDSVQAAGDKILRAQSEALIYSATVQELCGTNTKLAAKAIQEKWPIGQVKAEVKAQKQEIELNDLRANRGTMINTGAGSLEAGADCVLEAAVVMAGGMTRPELEKQYEVKVLEAADKNYGRSISLQEVILAAAFNGGYSGRARITDGNLRSVLQAAYSTNDINGLLSNIANKFLGMGFNHVESAWRAIAFISSPKDFKEYTTFSLGGDVKYKKLLNGGKIEHGELSDIKYTNKIDTSGRMLSITRQDIINDDLGALTRSPRLLGRGCALSFNEEFWTEFLDNAAFFTADNNNLFSGATSALSVDSLSKAEEMFFDQTDPDGNPLGIAPSILLVPNALNVLASQLMQSTELQIDGNTSAKKVGTKNPHAGKYSVVRSAYLNNKLVANGSATAWYNLADPEELPVIEVGFLNGKEEPTIETADADFDTLGIQLRGYHDWGVKKQEYRAGVKSAGQ